MQSPAGPCCLLDKPRRLVRTPRVPAQLPRPLRPQGPSPGWLRNVTPKTTVWASGLAERSPLPTVLCCLEKKAELSNDDVETRPRLCLSETHFLYQRGMCVYVGESICVWVCICLYEYMCECVYVCLFPSLCTYVDAYVCICVSVWVYMWVSMSLSVWVSEWKLISGVRLFATSWTMGFSRPEYWCG